MIEDEIFSEDDDEVEDEFPSKYNGKDWEPAHPYPDINRHRDAHVSRYQQGERPEDSDVSTSRECKRQSRHCQRPGCKLKSR